MADSIAADPSRVAAAIAADANIVAITADVNSGWVGDASHWTAVGRVRGGGAPLLLNAPHCSLRIKGVPSIEAE